MRRLAWKRGLTWKRRLTRRRWRQRHHRCLHSGWPRICVGERPWVIASAYTGVRRIRRRGSPASSKTTTQPATSTTSYTMIATKSATTCWPRSGRATFVGWARRVAIVADRHWPQRAPSRQPRRSRRVVARQNSQRAPTHRPRTVVARQRAQRAPLHRPRRPPPPLPRVQSCAAQRSSSAHATPAAPALRGTRAVAS